MATALGLAKIFSVGVFLQLWASEMCTGRRDRKSPEKERHQKRNSCIEENCREPAPLTVEN
jgi:hypothetical protein